MKRYLKRLRNSISLGVICLVAFCCAASPIGAAPPTAIQLRDFRIGFAGSFQVGTWTPASVVAIGDRAVSAKLVVVASDADGQLVSSEGPSQMLVPGKPHVLTAQFCAGRQSGDITFRVLADDVVTERKFRPGAGPVSEMPHELRRGFRQNVPFWGVCGVPEGVFRQLGAVPDEVGSVVPGTAPVASLEDQPPHLLRFSLSELPQDSTDMAALDLLVLAAGAASETGGTGPLFLHLSERQNAALREWVQVRGGHLVISLGSHFKKEFQDSKLGQWLALPIESEEEVRQLAGLEAYSGHAEPLKIDRPVPILQLSPKISGQVLAQSLGVPLLVQMPSGFGRISFLAVDLDKPPISNWAGTELMLQRLHRGDRSDLSRETRNQTTQLARPGINDLSSQLYAAEEEFPGVSRMSLWLVMLLLGIYILLVGPLDYVIVHRWLKRPNLTWITFPTWIFGGACFAFWLANLMNGSSLLCKQLEIVDIEATSGVIRARSWMTLYSPKTSRRQIELDVDRSDWLRDPQQTPFQPTMTWLALAENRVGGLYREGGVQLTQRQYQRTADGAGIADYPLQVWSTGRFGGEWSSVAPTLVDSNFTSSGFGQLKGTIKHRFPQDLEDCLLAYGNRVYFPVVRVDRKKTTNLPPFFEWEIGGDQPFDQRELRGYLTEIYTKQIQREGVKTGPEVLDVSKPYDPTRRDLPYILRMLSFHKSAGGRDYTGLRNDVLENLDLSQQIRMGRAVLVGRLKQPSAQWKVDGQPVADPETVTYVRVVLPVTKDLSSGYRSLRKPN